VVIADLDGDAAQRAADSVRGLGGNAQPYTVDVAFPCQLKALIEFISVTYGKLHVLFSHAGSQAPPEFELTEEQFDRAIDVNLKSHYFLTHYSLPLLQRCAPHASIIYTSSTAGLRASAGSPLYGVTKAGILMLMRNVAKQSGPSGVRANAICPGATDTQFAREFGRMMGMDDAAYDIAKTVSARGIPLGRIGDAEDVAGVVAFLASDQSKYVTGSVIPIDGGATA
jgi:3-oxoacyl-[acyl-carrier protein] reductase